MGARETDPDSQQGRKDGLQAVGAELAAAREKQQRSLTSVAADLHLSQAVVGALEAGDESALPAPAFVRGYIKSYARLLELEESALLSHLPEKDEHRVVPLKRVGMRRRGLSLPIGKWLVRGMALAAVLAVLVFAAPLVERLWSGKQPEPVQDALQIPQPGQGAPAELTAGPLLQGPGLPAERDIAAVPPAEPVALPSHEPEPEAEPEAASAPEPSEPAAGAETPVQPVAPRREGPAQVTLRFVEDSWVEMEAHGRKLVVGTQRAGSERTVSAEPPISLLLGNAPGVELQYRGKPVELAPYQRGNVARLTLKD